MRGAGALSSSFILHPSSFHRPSSFRRIQPSSDRESYYVTMIPLALAAPRMPDQPPAPDQRRAYEAVLVRAMGYAERTVKP